MACWGEPELRKPRTRALRGDVKGKLYSEIKTKRIELIIDSQSPLVPLSIQIVCRSILANSFLYKLVFIVQLIQRGVTDPRKIER